MVVYSASAHSCVGRTCADVVVRKNSPERGNKAKWNRADCPKRNFYGSNRNYSAPRQRSTMLLRSEHFAVDHTSRVYSFFNVTRLMPVIERNIGGGIRSFLLSCSGSLGVLEWRVQVLYSILKWGWWSYIFDSYDSAIYPMVYLSPLGFFCSMRLIASCIGSVESSFFVTACVVL